jgi:hypothetical protein
MSASDDLVPVLDSRLGRPYVATGGRTAPTAKLDIVTLLRSTGKVSIAHVGDDQARVLLLLQQRPMAVAEVSAHMKLPMMVVKVLVSDLLNMHAVQAIPPKLPAADDTDVLNALLLGLQRRL